jgi:hypothetical protein
MFSTPVHGHIIRVTINTNIVSVEKHEEKEDDLRDLGIDGKIILKWILKKWGLRLWTGFIWLRIGTSGGVF